MILGHRQDVQFSTLNTQNHHQWWPGGCVAPNTPRTFASSTRTVESSCPEKTSEPIVCTISLNNGCPDFASDFVIFVILRGIGQMTLYLLRKHICNLLNLSALAWPSRSATYFSRGDDCPFDRAEWPLSSLSNQPVRVELFAQVG